MVSRTVYLKADGMGAKEALNETESFCRLKENGLNRKEVLQMRLLAEELMGMVKNITEEYKAVFWLQYEDDLFELHIIAKTEMDYDKKKELLSVSALCDDHTPGIMSKIQRMMRACLGSAAEEGEELAYQSIPYMGGGMLSPGSNEVLTQKVWSLQKYREYVKEGESEQDDAWDELEKSIVANLADDIQVKIHKNQVELIVTKTFYES